MEPKTIYLKDYSPSKFLIDAVDLEVEVFEEKTIVRSQLIIRKNTPGQAHLELNGENMKLIQVSMDGKELGGNEYQLSDSMLVVLNVTESRFTIETTIEIDPTHNTALEGFYRSGEQLCTQCEPEGFRKITYYIDRPDVMAKFRTKMIADKRRFPFLLSNGNRIASGDLGQRHWVQWEDPFRKPSYLFAMVAGDFDVARDHFTTKSGRRVELEIYVDKGNLGKTRHAMESLKESMKWDEDTFGLEYDLDIYMIVAVDSFNMGAMENKGLNIFNSTYVLADDKSATDHDFQGIQSVIGHEYFHNWTGNRVTCRDWFQLTLKEGLTVYRDQEFSSDMLSRAVKRLEDVRVLKDRQFAEDAGPMAHPIRPSSYIEINNFYTSTVYEKGAEVIRMIATLIGKENFRKGMKKYFELFDGKAVTTEDFVHAMEVASGKDLSQFRNWYERPGTPTIIVESDVRGEELFLKFRQKYPPTTLKVSDGNVLHVPFRVGVLSDKGEDEKLLEIKNMEEITCFKVSGTPYLSLNRGFSAPVNVEYDYSLGELLHLMGQDTDPYCKYEATQKVYDRMIQEDLSHLKAHEKLPQELPDDFRKAMSELLNDERIDLSFKSFLLDLPSESGISQEMNRPDFDAIHAVHKNLERKIGHAFHDWFEKEYHRLNGGRKFELTPKAFGERALKNKALHYLVSSDSAGSKKILADHYERATNMTDEIAGLAGYVRSGVSLDHPAVRKFYDKWKGDSLVMLKWFGTLAAFSPKAEAVARIRVLENDPLFKKEVPNYMRALYFQFARNNLVSFHQKDGSGYEFLAEKIRMIDKINPQVASRGATSFSFIRKVDPDRQGAMKKALQSILSNQPSRDTFEVVSKYLAD
ncbi:MAG: aminopeptidase N [Bacteriovoracaceae bacterium]